MDEEAKADEDMKIQWFARGGGISRCGPFKSQIEATESMKLVDGGFPKDVFVWSERTKRKKARTT